MLLLCYHRNEIVLHYVAGEAGSIPATNCGNLLFWYKVKFATIKSREAPKENKTSRAVYINV